MEQPTGIKLIISSAYGSRHRLHIIIGHLLIIIGAAVPKVAGWPIFACPSILACHHTDVADGKDLQTQENRS
jgi:hypothetical protein